jgi:DNA-binding beta-propeller fold protein YncE
MLRIALISLFIFVLACSDSIGPSYNEYSKISIIDTSTGVISDEIDIDAGITRMCISPDGSYLYVVQYSEDDIIQVNCLTRSVSGSLSLGAYDHCIDLCLNDQGNELYANYYDKIFIIDVPSLTTGDSVYSDIMGVGRITYRPGTDLLYASFYQAPGFTGIYVIDVAQCEVVNTLDYWTSNLVFSETGNDLYINQEMVVKRVDPDLGYELASFNVNHMVSGICLDPSSNTVYVSWFDSENTEGGVISLDGSTLSLQDSVNINYGVSYLCHVPVKENLYLGIRNTLSGDKIIVLDLPSLNTINEINIPEGLKDMVADPSGDYVYCSIEYSVDP